MWALHSGRVEMFMLGACAVVLLVGDAVGIGMAVFMAVFAASRRRDEEEPPRE